MSRSKQVSARFRLSRAYGFAAVLLVGGCSSGVSNVKNSQAADANLGRPRTAAEQLAQGHDLYTQHCGTCHALPDPAAHPAEKWPHLVEWMRKRSNLDTTEAGRVLDWILSERARLTAK